MDSDLRDIKLNKLNERAKELKCLYQISEALKDDNAEIISIFNKVLDAIPPGYQHPTICEARIIFEGNEYAALDFLETEWIQKAELVIDNHVAGEIHVCYSQDIFENGIVFLPEEQKLLNAIADSLSRFIFHRRLKKTLELATNQDTGTESFSDSSLLAFESDEHWKWRFYIAEKIAGLADFELFGIQAVYLIGSAKTGNAGPASDIDLLIHFRGNKEQEQILISWLEGWGLGLSELNFHKTGYLVPGSLIDCHIITDEDILNKTSFGVMIGSTENSARLLRSRNN